MAIQALKQRSSKRVGVTLHLVPTPKVLRSWGGTKDDPKGFQLDNAKQNVGCVNGYNKSINPSRIFKQDRKMVSCQLPYANQDPNKGKGVAPAVRPSPPPSSLPQGPGIWPPDIQII